MSDSEDGGVEQCSECGRRNIETMEWGDRGSMPPVCMKCYFNPGWYRDTNK